MTMFVVLMEMLQLHLCIRKKNNERKPGRNIIQSAAIKDIMEYGEIKKEIME